MNFLKYSRTILLDDIDFTGQESICQSSILCIGCGGLASFVLPMVASNGISKLGIIDFDTIEDSNLPRQTMFTEEDIGKNKIDVAKEKLTKLHTECIIEAINGDHTKAEGIIHKYDAIADLTDSAASRIFCNRLSLKYNKPFFTGAALGFTGYVYSFANHLENMPCYECLFEEDKNYDSKTCENSGVFAPTVAVTGSFIVANILKYFSKMPLNFTQFLLLDLKNSNRSITMTKDPKCICSTQF